ncbi:DUF5133 domain-containing protein [Streptomyces sp. A3M-1-3]|uniref:DUF5133 domain-containing protein n=1 Tax=Streptomyces sp. A3M-1-3 TaxID=2962044 RepID=UPI0020B85632|nr:DUF5133 domain-containing protein [Streptomyces sp. A3M-1-3]MCP3819990.1 DUF5133 domain-containing protein [Streptomyces sp. A3M-1-3]
MLLPDHDLIGSLLIRYRDLERRMLADPTHGENRSLFEDAAYTLCVLLGQRTAREAALEAEKYVRQQRHARAGRAEGAAPPGGSAPPPHPSLR